MWEKNMKSERKKDIEARKKKAVISNRYEWRLWIMRHFACIDYIERASQQAKEKTL